MASEERAAGSWNFHKRFICFGTMASLEREREDLTCSFGLEIFSCDRHEKRIILFFTLCVCVRVQSDCALNLFETEIGKETLKEGGGVMSETPLGSQVHVATEARSKGAAAISRGE